MKKVVVVYPAGGGVPDGFDAKIRHTLSRAGYDPAFYPAKGQPPRGLVDLLLDAYVWAPPDLPVLRLDTAEHPIHHAPALFAEVERMGGMVVGDLRFGHADFPDTVVGETDRHIHEVTFPFLYGRATQGQAPLSCAHGFQAFGPGVLSQLLPAAHALVERVEKKLGGHMRWGLDGAMVLVAYHMKVPLTVVPTLAVQQRVRVLDKITQQLQSAVLAIEAAEGLAKEGSFAAAA